MDAKLFYNALISVSSDFVGLYEVENNKLWDDPSTPGIEREKSAQLRQAMAEFGWDPGEPYCAAFIGGMVALASKRLGLDYSGFRRIWTAHCMTNVAKFKRLGLLDQQPSDGSLMLMRKGTTSSGHAAIVPHVTGKYPNRMLATIEGNTMSGEQGDQREGNGKGDGIFIKARNVTRNGSLITQGFIPLPGLLTLLKDLH